MSTQTSEVRIRNQFFIVGDTVKIRLNRRNGEFVFASVSIGTFFAKVAPLAVTWSLMRHAHISYCYHKDYSNRAAGQTGGGESVYLHRTICGLGKGDPRVPDHKDFDGLNCVDDNLRIVSQGVNVARRRLNDKPAAHSRTGLRNITMTSSCRYSVTVARKHIGTYNNVVLAKKAAAQARKAYNNRALLQAMTAAN